MNFLKKYILDKWIIWSLLIACIVIVLPRGENNKVINEESLNNQVEDNNKNFVRVYSNKDIEQVAKADNDKFERENKNSPQKETREDMIVKRENEEAKLRKEWLVKKGEIIKSDLTEEKFSMLFKEELKKRNLYFSNKARSKNSELVEYEFGNGKSLKIRSEKEFSYINDITLEVESENFDGTIEEIIISIISPELNVQQIQEYLIKFSNDEIKRVKTMQGISYEIFNEDGKYSFKVKGYNELS